MQLTTENIIKILAKDENAAKALLDRFSNLNDTQRFIVERRIWDLYDLMYDGRVDTNLQKAFNEVADGKRKLDLDFYKQVKEQTDKEIEAEFYSDTQSADLAGVRDKISKIIGSPAT